MKVFFAYLAATALSCTLLGCSKKDSAAPSKTELLTNKNWIVSAETVSPGISVNGTVVTDLYGQIASCSKDDFIRFEAPNVYKEDEGATKCSTGSPQTVTGTWVFNSDQTVVTVTPGGSTAQSFNITTLTDTSLVVTFSEALNNITYTVTITYRKG